MKKTLEREVKLQAPAGFVLPQFPGNPIPPRRFTTTYYDTEDLRLASLRITLRRRVEKRKGVWQLKIPREGARLELEEPGGPARPPVALLSLLAAPLRGSGLQPVAKMRTLRTGTRVGDGTVSTAEVVFDTVQVMDGPRVARRFTEVEVELLGGGTEEDLQRLSGALIAVGAQPGDGRPKLFQALDIDPPDGTPPRKPSSELARIQAMIAEQFQNMVRHDPGTRLGDDPEDLHQHRVAIRKLRSLLASARMLEPEWTGALRRELEWIGDAMNPVRDLDVMIPYLRANMGHLEPDEAELMEPFVTKLHDEREQARTHMLAELSSDRYLALLNTLEAATFSLVVTPVDDDLASGAARQFRKMRKAAKGLQDPVPDEELHRVRRLAKKARYTADLVKPSGSKKVASYAAAVKAIQEVLGDFQDAVVADERIRSFLPDAGSVEAGFVLGRMAEMEAAKKRRAIAEFPAAWRQVARRGKDAWS